MSRQSKRFRQIKKEMRDEYVFTRHLSARQVANLLGGSPDLYSMTVVATLIIGQAKINVALYPIGNHVALGYDVYVKDAPDSKHWVCFESPTDEVSLKEFAIFAVLDRIVQENRLSYKNCSFEQITGTDDDTDKT